MPFNIKEYKRAYREKHKEKAKQYAKDYYQRNREKLLAQVKERYKLYLTDEQYERCLIEPRLGVNLIGN